MYQVFKSFIQNYVEAPFSSNYSSHSSWVSLWRLLTTGVRQFFLFLLTDPQKCFQVSLQMFYWFQSIRVLVLYIFGIKHSIQRLQPTMNELSLVTVMFFVQKNDRNCQSSHIVCYFALTLSLSTCSYFFSSIQTQSSVRFSHLKIFCCGSYVFKKPVTQSC